MIYLTRLQGESLVLNSELLLLIERTPDTTLVLVSGQRIMVQETPEEVVDRVVLYRRRIGMPETLWNPDFVDEAKKAAVFDEGLLVDESSSPQPEDQE